VTDQTQQPDPATETSRTLVIDCATDACSVALFDGPRLVAGELRLLGRGHAEALVPMIAQLPERGRADRIAVALGPGSFTGVRVGLATARALALAWGAATCGYSTLAMIAAMARDEAGVQAVGVATTGGHGEWFTEGFDAQGTITRALASLHPDGATAATGEDLVAGNKASALVQARGHGKALDILPDARAFTLLPPQAFLPDMHPVYGRVPDAKLPARQA
jgi:tRNA threonylcarbamoyl adenosine modification protein YeaZ